MNISKLAGILLLVLTVISDCARAAEITVIKIPGLEFSFVRVKGEIVEGDGNKFYEAVDGIDRATVVLDGPGGIIKEALQIGSKIRLRNYATMVADNAECYSACGLIWVSGARRYMSASSQIGFHAANRAEKGEYQESGVANAEVGSFLTLLGLRIEAIRFFTTAGPSEILLLTPERARALGIDIFELSRGDLVTPEKDPTVDVYADRFVALASLKARCTPFFLPKLSMIERGVKIAYEKGNKIVSGEMWVKLMTQRLDSVKREFDVKGTLLYCIDIESELRRQDVPTGIDGPSFACRDASTPTELAMCEDRDLWAKDRAMNAIYLFVRRLAEVPVRKRLLAAQREWLGRRNSCGADTECLNRVYDDRLEELREIDLPS